MTQTPLKILLGPELFKIDGLVPILVATGDEVSCLPEGHDVIISFDAWRVPPGTTGDELLKSIGMVLKQIRATKHVQDPSEDIASVRVTKKPRKPAKRKPTTKDSDPGVVEETGT